MDVALVQVSEPEIPEGVEPHWRATSLSDADWCLEEIGKVEAALEQNEAVLAAAVARAEAWRDAERAKLDRRADFFRSHLVAFATAHRSEILTGKAKSRKLPHGTLAFRKTGGSLKVKDPSALLEWLREQKMLAWIRVTEAPDVNEVKAYFKSSGECPPGCDVESVGEEFQAKAEVKS